MIKIMKDGSSVLIEFEAGTAGYAEELDPDRIVDYSLNPGEPIGVCLHNVDRGVVLEGLPHQEQIRNILTGIGVDSR